MEIVQILKYEFIKNALLAGILASVICGMIGTVVVNKRIVSLSGAVAHSSFGGVGLGYLMGVNPFWGALLFALLSGVSIGYISKKTSQHEDTSIGIIWAFGMSLGIIFVGISKGYAPDLFTYLFGNILSVVNFDIFMLMALCLIILISFFLLFKEINAICFDEVFAFSRGIPVFKIYILILILVSLTVVVLMKIVGVILVIALLTIAPASSVWFNSSLKSQMFCSCILNIVFVIGGLLISYYLNLPTGATIIVFAVFGFIVSSLISKIVKKN